MTQPEREGVNRKSEVGKVKWFNDARGCGLITADGREDVFAHYSSIHVCGFKGIEEG